MVARIPRGSATFFVVLISTLVLVGCGGTTGNMKSTVPNFGCGCGFLYATTTTNQVLAFKLDPNGVPGAPVSVAGPANSSGISSANFDNGMFLYASDPVSNVVDAFAIDNMNGRLTPGSPVAAPGSPAGMTVTGYSMALTYLYAADMTGTINAFAAQNGNLNRIGGFNAGASPVQVAAVSSTQSLKTFLYAPDSADPNGGVYAFAVALDGTLSPVPGSPFATGAIAGPQGIASAGNGPLFVALSNSNQVAGFSADAAGILSSLPGSPYAAGHSPTSVVTASGPSGSGFVYALNSADHTISAYSFNYGTGAVAAVNGSPFPAGTATQGLATYQPNGTDVVPSILYVADQQGKSILAFSINTSTGQLTPLPGSPFAAGAGPVALTTVQLPGNPIAIDPP